MADKAPERLVSAGDAAVRCPICRSTRVEFTATVTHDVLAVLTHWLWLLLVPLIKLFHPERGQTRRCLDCGHIWRR